MLEETLLREAIGLMDELREDNTFLNGEGIETILSRLKVPKEGESSDSLRQFCREYDGVLWQKLFGQYLVFQEYTDFERRVTPSKAYSISYGRVLKNALVGGVLGLMADSAYVGLAGAVVGAGITLLDEVRYYGTFNLAKVFTAAVVTGTALHYFADMLPFAESGGNEGRDIIAAGAVGLMIGITECTRAKIKASRIDEKLIGIESKYRQNVAALVEKYTSTSLS